MVPMILIPYGIPSARGEELNTTKDFALSSEYTISEESITSFEETLPNDVLFYPDRIETDEIVTATTGNASGSQSGTWERTTELDASYWTGATEEDYLLQFVGPSNMSGIEYALYFMTVTNTPKIQFWNFETSAWVDTDDPEDDSWCNGTISNPNLWNATYGIIMQLHCEAFESAQWDYAQLSFYVMTLTDSEHFGEDFADVSEWTVENDEGGETMTSDGDVGTFSAEGDGVSDSDFIVNQEVSLSDGCYYIEIRYKLSSTDALDLYLYLLDEDVTDYSEIGRITFNMRESTSWHTSKFHTDNYTALSDSFDGTIETVMFRVKADLDDDIDLELDYFRISLSNETGFQHDGSITEGISSSDGGTIATDGDLVTLTADSDGATFLIVADITTTASAISTSLYPFFGINITSGSGSWTLEQYDGASYATLQSSTSISANISRFNMNALDTYVSWLRITLTANGVMVSDWIKAYSIANYTVSMEATPPPPQSFSVEITDVLYCDSGILYADLGTFLWVTLFHDPVLSFATGIGGAWNITTTQGTPETNYYVGSWTEWATETSGDLEAGTLTDIKIRFTGSANIDEINFLVRLPEWFIVGSAEMVFDTPEWNIITTVIITFVIELFTGNLDALMILFGLIMIPASTLYLVYGGREKLTKDKGFYFMIAFLIGWALLIGGII